MKRNKYDTAADQQRSFAMQALSPDAAAEHRHNAMLFDKMAHRERESEQAQTKTKLRDGEY